MLWTHSAAAGLCVMGPACHLPTACPPLPALCCRLGTCYGQGQLLGGVQHVPGQAVDQGSWCPAGGGLCPGSFQKLGSPYTPAPGLWRAALAFSWIPDLAPFWPLP